VAILPGSRRGEVVRILPDLMAAARLMQRDLAAAQFVVARAPHLDDRLFDGVRAAAAGASVVVVEGDTDTVLASADVAHTASGTATVQAALHDTPMVIVYRMAQLSYQLARRVVTLDAIGMVNLIAGETVAPELVQDAFTPEAVAREALSMLTDRDRAAAIRAGLAKVRARLGGPGASRRAAQAILRIADSGLQIAD
jgi:lipid-A-disaccharide synthase